MNEEGAIIQNFSMEETIRYKYPDAGAGLRKMYVSFIGMIVCIVPAMIPIINILALIVMIFFFVYNMVGMFQAGKDIGGCKIAAIIQAVAFASGIIENFVNLPPLATSILSLAGSIMGLIGVYLVCHSVSEVMMELNAYSVAKQGKRAWLIYLVCNILIVVFGILLGSTLVFAMRGVTASAASITTLVFLLFGIIAALVIYIVAFVTYLKFLKKSAEQLGAY